MRGRKPTLAAIMLILLAGALASASPVPALAWRIEPVDVGHVVSDEIDLDTDSTGAVHAVYFRYPNTIYVKQEIGLWMEQFATPEGGASIAIGPDERPHIAHGAERVRYATKVDGAWIHEIIYEGNFAGYWTDTAVDSQSRPHIVFNAGSPGGNVGYALRDDAGWHVEIVTNDGGHQTAAVAVDGADRPHIVYIGEGLRVYHLVKTNGGWQRNAVTTQGDLDAPDLAIDGSDKLHVTYNDQWFNVYYATSLDGATWDATVAFTTLSSIWESRIAVHENGAPHMAFTERICFCQLEILAGHPWYATLVDGEWVKVPIDPEVASLSSAITVDDRGIPRVLYVAAWSQTTRVNRWDLMFAEPLVSVTSRVPIVP